MIKIVNYKDVDLINFWTARLKKSDVSATVANIIDNVKINGDKALIDYAKQFDNADISELQVKKSEIEQAYKLVDSKLIDVLNNAAKNIKDFHSNQLRQGFKMEKDGIVLGQKITAIENVGIYVPGGSAAYPSTVLMNAIPAKIAGCKQIIMVTPPLSDGSINPAILAAAHVAGVDRIFKTGGAQAVAALAYGTDSIPKVDKIVGPGNVFVAEAKRQVFGLVSIDMIAGPSEILIVSDNNSRADFIAADLISQAEHDKSACSILVTDSIEFAKNVQNEIDIQLDSLKRQEIARESIENFGKIIIVDSIEQAIDVANKIAPEHLELCIDNAPDYLDKVINAGSVFIGRYCPECLGDYYAGPNHTLPTNGTARFSNPLSVDDFIKKTQFSQYSKEAFQKIAFEVEYFANQEGLTGHAKSAKIRLDE